MKELYPTSYLNLIVLIKQISSSWMSLEQSTLRGRKVWPKQGWDYDLMSFFKSMKIFPGHKVNVTNSKKVKEWASLFLKRVKPTNKHGYVHVQHAEHRWHSKLLVNTRHHPRSTITYKVWDLKWVVSCVCVQLYSIGTFLSYSLCL